MYSKMNIGHGSSSFELISPNQQVITHAFHTKKKEKNYNNYYIKYLPESLLKAK